MPPKITTLEERLQDEKIDALIKQAQIEEMETYTHYLATGEVRYLNSKGGIQLNSTVGIHYKKYINAFTLSYPDNTRNAITIPITKETMVTMEKVLRMRRLNDAEHIALPIKPLKNDAKINKPKAPKDK